MNALIYDTGDGFAGVGEYVTQNGALFFVTRVHTMPGVNEWIHATVEPVDWNELPDDMGPRGRCRIVADDELVPA